MSWSSPRQYVLQAIREIECAGYFLGQLEFRIQKPFAIIDERKIRGFRFAKPNIINYVVLNIARSLSLLNSMILLRDNGFKCEFAIITRSLLENTTKLSYVIGGLNSDGIDRKTKKFLEEFFSDNVRDVSKRSIYKPVSQKDIHRRNSERLTQDIEFTKAFGIAPSIENDDNRYAKLTSSLYSEYSNHVHGRYPEMMDIYGEKSVQLKINGNIESDDIDGDIEVQLIESLANGVVKGLRTALLSLQLCGEIVLNEKEMRFCLDDMFAPSS